MKVAILSESAADEAAIRLFVEGLLGAETEVPANLPIRSRGWPAVRNSLATVLRHLHYRSEVEALVVVVDSDRTAVHDPADCEPPQPGHECRLCDLTAVVQRTRRELSSRPGLPSIETAIGLAVPQIEAWYLVGRDHQVSEATWNNARKNGQFAYAPNQLKQKVYGTDRPTLELEIQRASQEASRIVDGGNLPQLEKLFPRGFGALADDVRRWHSDPEK